MESARPLLRGVDLDDRQDERVGSRPCTADGLPLVEVGSLAQALTALEALREGEQPELCPTG